MSTASNLETIATALGWADYQTTGSLDVGPSDTLQISDGNYWYLVDEYWAWAWASDYEANKDGRPYDDFCRAVDHIDPMSLGSIRADRKRWAGLCGVGGDIYARVTAPDADKINSAATFLGATKASHDHHVWRDYETKRWLAADLDELEELADELDAADDLESVYAAWVADRADLEIVGDDHEQLVEAIKAAKEL